MLGLQEWQWIYQRKSANNHSRPSNLVRTKHHSAVDTSTWGTAIGSFARRTVTSLEKPSTKLNTSMKCIGRHLSYIRCGIKIWEGTGFG